jgi:nuclear pore complex protein Nup155
MLTTPRFGRTQLAAMGITLGAQADLKQADTASAVNSIVLSGGAPALRDGTSGRSIVYSSRHDGLAITLARLLRPLWNVRVTVIVAGGRQVLSLPESQLLSVQGRLEQLRRYVEE